MNTIQRIVKNVGVLVLGNIVQKILTLVLFIYIARFLGSVGFGQYTFIISFVGMFGIITGFGLDNLMQRDVARDKAKTNKYLSNVSFMRIILFPNALILIIISINLLNYPKNIINLVYLYSIYLLLSSIAYGFRNIFLAHEKMEYEFIIVVLNRAIVVLLSIVTLYLGYGVFGLLAALIAGEFFSLIFSFLIIVKKIAIPKFGIDLEFCKDLIQRAFPFIFLSVFVTIYYNIDTVMLSKMQGDEATGLYNSAARLLSALLIIPYAFIGSIFPTMSRFYVESKDRLKLAHTHALRYLLIVSLPMALGTFLLADRIIVRVYGGEFSEAAIALQILVWATAFKFLNSALFTVLLSINKEKTNTKIMVSGIILNVLLNLVLIPKFSYAGASFATVVAEALFFILSFYVVSQSLHRLPIHKLAFKPAIATLAMAAFILYFREIITLFIIIPLAAVLYFAALFVLTEFSEEDFKLMRKAIKRE